MAIEVVDRVAPGLDATTLKAAFIGQGQTPSAINAGKEVRRPSWKSDCDCGYSGFDFGAWVIGSVPRR